MRIGFSTLLLILLVVGLAAGASFGGGIVLGRNTAKTPTPAALAVGGQSAAAGGAAGASGRTNLSQSGQAGGTLGTVESVQGDTVTVKGSDGSSAQYTTSADTQIEAAAPSSLSALKPGDLVQVGSGQPDASGHQTARSILVLPARQAGAATGTPGARGAGSAGTAAVGTAAGGRRSGGASSQMSPTVIVPAAVTPIPVASGTPINP